jgi:hypothetical protein
MPVKDTMWCPLRGMMPRSEAPAVRDGLAPVSEAGPKYPLVMSIPLAEITVTTSVTVHLQASQTA